MSTETQKVDVTRFAFGPLTFSTKGLGVFFMSEKLQERIDAMSVSDLRVANRDAWRQLRPLVRAANRECNVSRYGWNDKRDHVIDVCEVIKKATWRALARVGGAE
jgi:hypothetical protein